jgi:hypothetical protein
VLPLPVHVSEISRDGVVMQIALLLPEVSGGWVDRATYARGYLWSIYIDMGRSSDRTGIATIL